MCSGCTTHRDCPRKAIHYFIGTLRVGLSGAPVENRRFLATSIVVAHIFEVRLDFSHASGTHPVALVAVIKSLVGAVTYSTPWGAYSLWHELVNTDCYPCVV